MIRPENDRDPVSRSRYPLLMRSSHLTSARLRDVERRLAQWKGEPHRLLIEEFVVSEVAIGVIRRAQKFESGVISAEREFIN